MQSTASGIIGFFGPGTAFPGLWFLPRK